MILPSTSKTLLDVIRAGVTLLYVLLIEGTVSRSSNWVAMVDVTSCEYAVLYSALNCTCNVTGKITGKIRLKFFPLRLNLNFLCLLALTIHELGVIGA